MKNFLIILAICVVVVIIVFVIINTSKDKQDEIIMVTEAGFAPYEFYEGQDIVGVDVKIAQAIADELGKKLVIRDMDFDSLINEVKSGKADFAAARTINNRGKIKRSRFFNRICCIKTSNSCKKR